MQDTDNLKPIPEEDEDTAGSDTGEKEGDPIAFSEDKTSENLGSIPEEDTPELSEDEVIPPLQERVDTPEFEPLEPADEIQPAEGTLVDDKVVESKTRRFFRRFIRWTAGLLIIFGLGFLTGIFMIYQPAQQASETRNQQIAADLDTANDQILDLQNQIVDLKGQIADLEPLEATNNNLLAAQADFQIHIAILDARLDVANAMLSLKDDDSAQARISLAKTGETLDTISELLEPGQRDVVVEMAKRLDQVLSEIADNLYAAESDLDVLATDLLRLEDALLSD